MEEGRGKEELAKAQQLLLERRVPLTLCVGLPRAPNQLERVRVHGRRALGRHEELLHARHPRLEQHVQPRARDARVLVQEGVASVHRGAVLLVAGQALRRVVEQVEPPTARRNHALGGRVEVRVVDAQRVAAKHHGCKWVGGGWGGQARASALLLGLCTQSRRGRGGGGPQELLLLLLLLLALLALHRSPWYSSFHFCSSSCPCRRSTSRAASSCPALATYASARYSTRWNLWVHTFARVVVGARLWGKQRF